MTYEESGKLMTDIDFRNRVKVAAIKYADSIMIELPSVPAHNARMRWATRTFEQPDNVAMQLQGPTVMDPAVQSAGVDPNGKSLVADPALQGAVEATANKMI